MSDSDSSPLPKFRKPLPEPKRPVPPSPGGSVSSSYSWPLIADSPVSRLDLARHDLAHRDDALLSRRNHPLIEDQAKEDLDGASVSASDESADDRWVHVTAINLNPQLQPNLLLIPLQRSSKFVVRHGRILF